MKVQFSDSDYSVQGICLWECSIHLGQTHIAQLVKSIGQFVYILVCHS